MTLKLSLKGVNRDNDTIGISYDGAEIGTIVITTAITKTIEGSPDAVTICGAVRSIDGTGDGFLLQVPGPEFVPASVEAPIVAPKSTKA